MHSFYAFAAQLKRHAWLGVIVATIGLSGCNTIMLTGSAPIVSTKNTYTPASTDAITGIGQAKDTDPENIIIVGKNNLYRITQGGIALQDILGTIDGQYLALYKNESPNLVLHEQTFSGTLYLQFDKPQSLLSDTDKATLERTGFKLINSQQTSKQDTQRYLKTLTLEGNILPVSEDTYTLKSTFDKELPVKFSTKKTSSSFNPGTLVALPVTVALDIVTLPFQIFFLSAGNSSAPQKKSPEAITN